MTLFEVQEILEAEVLVGHDQLDMEVNKAGCADSMADVLFFGTSGMLLLTGLTNPQVIHTADILGLVAIVIVRGKRPSPETIKLAEDLRIPILATDCILFEAAGRLYMRGMKAIAEKIRRKHHIK
jgi:predicted transcriptional regulator